MSVRPVRINNSSRKFARTLPHALQSRKKEIADRPNKPSLCEISQARVGFIEEGTIVQSNRVAPGNEDRYARQPIRRAKLVTAASLTLVLGFIATVAAGCSSATPSLQSNSHQPGPGEGGAYASGNCFYSNDSGAERNLAGRALHWCGPEPRAVN